MSKHLTLEEGKRLLEEYGLHQVVIIGRRVGEDGYVNVLTHGTDMAHSAVAARIGECLKTEVMGWPEAHEAEVGERVRLARAAPKMVEALKAVRDRMPPAEGWGRMQAMRMVDDALADAGESE